MVADNFLDRRRQLAAKDIFVQVSTESCISKAMHAGQSSMVATCGNVNLNKLLKSWDGDALWLTVKLWFLFVDNAVMFCRLVAVIIRFSFFAWAGRHKWVAEEGRCFSWGWAAAATGRRRCPWASRSDRRCWFHKVSCSCARFYFQCSGTVWTPYLLNGLKD